MKKKKNSKRLPKYALGTMKLGYLRGRGMGTENATTEYGTSLQPEIEAIKANTLPTAINSFAQYLPYIKSNLDYKSTVSTTPTRSIQNVKNAVRFTNPSMNTVLSDMKTQPVINSAVSNAPSVPGGGLFVKEWIPKSIDQITAENGGKLLTKSAQDALDKQISESMKNQVSKKVLLGRIGDVANKALGVVGSVKGIMDLGMQAADFGSHRSSGDMLANTGRQHYTTEYGNTYDNYIGPSVSQEKSLEAASATAKQANWAMSSIGTGATIGGTIGSFVPGLGNLLGTGIGAIGGAIIGGLGSLFGWGDNTEDVEREARMLLDNILMYNKQQRAVAQSKDVSAEFNDRQSIGMAATGKEEGGDMENESNIDPNETQPVFGVNGWHPGIPGSKGMSGELIILGRGKNRKYTDIPSTGNKKDDEKDSIPLDVKPGDPHTIVRKDLAKLTKAVLDSDYREDFKDWYVDQVEELQSEERYNKDMKKYKCGKKPGYARGKTDYDEQQTGSWLDYIIPSAYGLYSLTGLMSERNRIKRGSFPLYPGVPENAGAVKAIDILGSRKYNVDPILDLIHKDYRYYLHNINHSGASAGEKSLQIANAFNSANEAKFKASSEADKINNQYIADYASAIRDYGNRMLDLMVNNNAQRMSLWLAQNAAKENELAENTRSSSNVFGAWMKDLLGANQFHRSQDFQNKMLKLYGDNLDIESTKVANDWAQSLEMMRFRREQAAKDEALARETAEKKANLFNMSYPWQYKYDWRNYKNLPTSYNINLTPKLYGYKEGKDPKRYVTRYKDGGNYYHEDVSPGLLFPNTNNASSKTITSQGDTIYLIPSLLFPNTQIRKKGAPATKEYLKAKQKHERLLNGAFLTNNPGWQSFLDLMRL